MGEYNSGVAEPNVKKEQKEKKKRGKVVILYNDDFNTFEHVIGCLIKHCKMRKGDAEVCAWKVHNDGKCVVYESNDEFELEFVKNLLLGEGLGAELEEI